MDLQGSLADLRRLGMHLDPAESAEADERRRVRLNTRVYPATRAMGFQLLLVVVVVHNAVVFDAPAWGPVLLLALVMESYVVLSWLALRRWFLTFPALGGWDLGDLLLAADLLLWAGAIRVTGGPLSLLWILPVLRVADHQTVGRAWVFAHLAPFAYGLAAFWPPRPVNAGGLEGDVLKMGLVYAAGLYIAWTGVPARTFRVQREAALSAAAGLLGSLTERTERLDAARRSRSSLLEELGGGIRTSLIEIVGFSRFLLRSSGERTGGEQRYVERIHDESRSALRELEALTEWPGAPVWPRVSLSGILQKVASAEASDIPEWREQAVLDLPYADVEIRADARRLTTLLRHVLSAARHFEGGPPRVELRVDAAVGLAEAVVLVCPSRVAAGAAPGELFNPFSGAASGDRTEMTARLELSIARSIARSLGYEIEVEGGAEGTRLVVKLR